MTKVVTALLGRKPTDANTKENAARAEGANERDAGVTSIDMGAKLGKEHEALRALLDEASRRVDSLDLVEESYRKLSEPIGKAMQALEQEKVHNAALQSLLNGLTEAHEKQRNELASFKQRAGSLEVNNATLRADLERMQEHVRSLDTERLQLVDDLVGKRTQLGSLERRFAQEAAECRRLAEDCGSLSLQLKEAQTRVAQSEGEAAEASEKSALAEAELISMRKSLDEAVAELTRLSRRVTETGSELVVANAEDCQARRGGRGCDRRTRSAGGCAR